MTSRVYAEVQSQTGPVNLKVYSKNRTFYRGDILVHQEFGIGYVQSTFANKIEVMFGVKKEILTHKIIF